MLQILNMSVLEIEMLSAVIFWGSSIRVRDLKRLKKLIKKDGFALGTTMKHLEMMVKSKEHY